MSATVVRTICLAAILICGVLVIVFAVGVQQALPLGVASDIVPVIVEAPESDRMDAARQFLEDRTAKTFHTFQVLGGVIVGCSVIGLLAGFVMRPENR